MNWNKTKTLSVLAVIAVLLAGALLITRNNRSRVTEEEGNLIAEMKKEGEIEVKGEIACLPYRSGEKGECVKGLKGEDGKMYALNSVAVKGIEGTMDEGTDVTALGKFEPADTANTESNVFVYDGVLVARILKVR